MTEHLLKGGSELAVFDVLVEAYPDSLSTRDIGHAVGKSRSYTLMLLNGLEERELVERIRVDGRTSVWRATDDALEVAVVLCLTPEEFRCAPAAEPIEKLATVRLSAGDLELLVEGLGLLAAQNQDGATVVRLGVVDGVLRGARDACGYE